MSTHDEDKHKEKPPPRWPLAVIGAPAFVAVWSGWVGLGEMTGFGMVKPFPGLGWGLGSIEFNSAITLPIGVEAYAAVALSYSLSSRRLSAATRRFAGWSAGIALVIGAAGQAAYHLLKAAQADAAPWWITAFVSVLPVAVLGVASVLFHMVHTDARNEDPAHADRDEEASTPVPADEAPAPAVVDAEPVRVDAPVDAEPAPAAGPVHPADAPDAVQVDSTGPSTPRVDAAPAVVDDRVDAVVDEAAPQGPADAEPAPAPAVASTQDEAPAAARVDEADTIVHPAPSAPSVHLDEAWTAPSVHPAPGADGVDGGPLWPADRVPVATLGDRGVDAVHPGGEDEDPDDDGPRGGVPAPGPLVAAGHTGAGAYDAGEPSRSQVRDAVDTARWEDAVSKKSKVMALLTTHMGDAAAVMADYRTRTGEDAPKSDIYRSGPRGYAWTWHHTAASRLVRRQGDVDVVRGILRDAGVDADHPGVVSALEEWAAQNSHVVPFRRHVPQGT